MPLPGLLTVGLLASALDPLTLSYAGSGQLSSSTTNPSIASVPIGTAAANRWVVVVVGSNVVNDVISAVTIGGISATIVVQKGVDDGSGFGGTIALAIANVPTGTIATVAWTIGNASNAHMATAYALTGLQSSTATDSGSSGAYPGTANINVNAGGCAIAGSVDNIFSTAHTWSGLTKDFDATLAGAITLSSASKLFVAAQSPLAISCTPASGIADALVAASFR